MNDKTLDKQNARIGRTVTINEQANRLPEIKLKIYIHGRHIKKI